MHVGDPTILKRLDDFSAPRLVEYFDENPCQVFRKSLDRELFTLPPVRRSAVQESRAEADLGVTIEAQFTVGEYDIVILSAKESNGLQTWLNRNGYKIPVGHGPYSSPIFARI